MDSGLVACLVDFLPERPQRERNETMRVKAPLLGRDENYVGVATFPDSQVKSDLMMSIFTQQDRRCSSSGQPDKMKQLLFSVLVLVLVSLCSGQAAVCRQQPCPEYQTVDTNEDFEERRYVASDWITTKVDSTSDIDMVAASNRLKAYCQSLKEAGHEMPDSWPVLITVREGEDALDLSLSWFVPPGVKAGITDASVTLQHKDAATVYVRAFSGTPSLSSGQENVQILREALVKAGKSFDLRIFVGVGYEPYYSLIHHNEVWIYAA